MQIGLYYLRDKLGRKPQARLTDTRLIGNLFQIRDRDGKQIILSRQDAVVARLALGVALRK